jgi:hypothetical protein
MDLRICVLIEFRCVFRGEMDDGASIGAHRLMIMSEFEKCARVEIPPSARNAMRVRDSASNFSHSSAIHQENTSLSLLAVGLVYI